MKHSLNILLVEDDANDALLLMRALRQGDYDLNFERVDSAAGVRAALIRQEWDVVISDYSMPHFDGLTALRMVKAHHENLPFILVSGTVGEDIAVGAMRAGANDYVMKDSLSRLLPAVERELREAGEHRKQEAGRKALAESEERFRSFMRHFPGLAYIKDYTGCVIFANEGFATYLGLDPATLPGKTNYDLFPHDFAERITRDDQQVVATGRVMTLEESFGGRTWSTYKFPIGDGESRRLLAGFTLDVTEMKRLQQELMHSQKMESVGQLAGGVAHDFNNLLQAILGYTELLISKTVRSDERYADLVEIQKTGLRAADLTRQLLAFARKQPVAPGALDLNEAIEGMLKMLRRLIGEHVDLVWTPGVHVWPVWMDPVQIDQVLANLCVNARDAGRGECRITIATGNLSLDPAACANLRDSAPGDYVMLSVCDNGCGMDKDVLSHIFEPFFTTKGVGQGTGLGLATVYGIVKQNNGFINVRSEPGKGSVFDIYLPRHDGVKCSTAATVPGEEMPGSRGEVVLLVEDEPTILSLGQRLLERLGYTVLTARTSAEALQVSGDCPGEIHLLITDVVMPGGSGRDLAQCLKAARPKTKALFMSGYTADIIARHGVLEKGLHFIQKPFTGEALATKIREILDEQ